MKKVKPWMLTLGSLVVASATVATLATTFSNVVQQQYKISDNNQTRSSGLPTPRAIDNNIIKSDWQNYQKIENKQAKVYAQHNYVQKHDWYNTWVATFTTKLLNYSSSTKKFNGFDSIMHGQGKIDTFSYGNNVNKNIYQDWKNLIENAMQSVRAKSRTSTKNHTPLFSTTSNRANQYYPYFVNFETNGNAQGGKNTWKEEQFWVDPIQIMDDSMVSKLGTNATIFGKTPIHSETATNMLWGGIINPQNRVMTAIYEQNQTPSYQTEDDQKWYDFFWNAALSETDAKNFESQKHNLEITGDDNLYYNEKHFGLSSNMIFSRQEQVNAKNGMTEGRSTIFLYDATNLTNNGDGEIYRHTSRKNNDSWQGHLPKNQKTWFETKDNIYGYNQFLEQKNNQNDFENIEYLFGEIKNTNNTSINMDLNLANFISVQALTNHKDSGDVNTMNGQGWPSVQLGWNQTRMQQYKDKTLFAEYFSALANHIQNVELQRNADANSLANYYTLATDIYNENIDVQGAYDIVNQIVLNPENTHFYYTKALTKNANEQEVNVTNLDDMTKAIVSKTYGYNKVLPQFFSNDIYATVVHENGSTRPLEVPNTKIYDGATKTWQKIHYNDGQGKPWETFDNYVSTTIKDLKMVDGNNNPNGSVLANSNTRGLSGNNIRNAWTTQDTQSNFKYDSNNHKVENNGNGIKFTWKWNMNLNNKLFDDKNFTTNGIELDYTPSSVFESSKSSTSYVDKPALINKTEVAIGIEKINKKINQDKSFNASDHNTGQLDDSLTKSKNYYNQLIKADSDLTKRTQAYYNAKKDLDTQKMIHFNVDTNNVPLQYWFKEKTYQDATTNKIITKKDSKDTSHFIKYSFDYDYLKLNDLKNYLEVTFDATSQIATIKVKLDTMKQAIGNWNNLTTKAKVFDNNGLHEYFNETFETFWNEVLNIANTTQGVSTGKLKAEDFKNNVKFTKSNKSTRANQTIKEILENDANAFGGIGASKKGWEEPIGSNPIELVYKFSTATPKYQDGTNAFANRINSAQVTQQDDLTNAQTANNEYTQKNKDLNSVKTEQENITNQVSQAETNLKAHLETITKAQSNWDEYINSVLGTPDEPGNGSATFKQKFKEITESGDAQIAELIKKSEEVYKETLGKFEEEMQIYRPFNWMWLVAKSEITQEQVDKYNAEFTNKILDIEQKTSQALTDLLALKDPTIKKEFNDKRNELYKTLQSTLDQYKTTLTTLQSKISEQKTKNTEIQTWMNANKNHQDTIEANVEINVLKDGVQLYKPKNVDASDTWITKKDRWWTMYNPTGQQDPNNQNNKTKYLFDKDKLIKNLNQKIVDAIKRQDQDFNITLVNKNIIEASLIEGMSGSGSTTDHGNTITIGNNEHQYEISPALTYTLEEITGTQELKINSMLIQITAVNQFIKQTNEKIAALEGQINTNETNLKTAETKVNNLLTGTDTHSVTQLEVLITNMNKTTVEQDVAAKNHAYNWKNTSKPSELKVGSYYHQKLNPLFIITMSVLLVVLLILLILLLVWLKKSNYRYRYVV